MEQLLILNLNQNSFFRYIKKSDDDTGYKTVLKSLVNKSGKETLSHWSKEDKIVFVPQKKELYEYVNKNYNELFL